MYAEGAFQYLDRKEAQGICACILHSQCQFLRGTITEEWARIPDNVEILMTHTPPSWNLGHNEEGKARRLRSSRDTNLIVGELPVTHLRTHPRRIRSRNKGNGEEWKIVGDCVCQCGYCDEKFAYHSRFEETLNFEADFF